MNFHILSAVTLQKIVPIVPVRPPPINDMLALSISLLTLSLRVTHTQSVLFVSIEQNLKLLVCVPAGGTLLRAFFEVAVPSLRLNSQESKILCLINTFVGQVLRPQATNYVRHSHLPLLSSGIDVEGTRPYIISGPESCGQSQPVHSFTSKALSRHDAVVRRAGEVAGAKVMAAHTSKVAQTAAALQLYVEENIHCALINSSWGYH
jgi:hypothetical protein